MVSIVWAVLVVGLVLSLSSLAAGEAPRVLAPPRLPEDARLGKPRDYDSTTVFPLRYDDRRAWEQHREQVRRQIQVANGLWPMPPGGELQPVIHGAIDRGDYTVEKAYFQSLPGHYVTGNLYRPKGKAGKLPGVLCPHGHWPNGRFVEVADKDIDKQIASGAEQTREGARYPLQARCATLARLGCVVFHYDMVGYCDSKPIAHREGFKDAADELRLQSQMGLQTWNSIRALDFLLTLPEVDATRLAVTGASGGATQTMMIAALDDRVAVDFPAVMVSQNMQGGCVCENSSLLRVGINNIEIAAVFAPKPQAMTGADDWTKDIETAGLPDLKRIYGLYGAEANVAAKYYSFPHNYNQVAREMMYNWFNRHLKLGAPEPVKEKPFEPIAPKDLSVWDDAHPMPKDFVDAAALKKTLAAISDRQLADLKRDPAEFRRAVGAALKVMVHDDGVPTDVEAATAWKRDVAGVATEALTLSRAGAGEAVPALLLTPAGWTGTTVIWAHPAGKASLYGADGKPVEAARKLLEARSAILAADLFLTGEYQAADKPTTLPILENYAKYGGLYYGYNRSILANRVHDLLTCVAFARQRQAKAVQLLGLEGAGPWALIARALAGSAIDRAAIDLHGFDFDQVKAADDENMLPGALKYGGIMSVAALCDDSPTTLFNAPGEQPAVATASVKLEKGPADAQTLVRSLGRL